jgi:hypothetical protein
MSSWGKILIWLGILLLVMLAAFGAWYFFFYKPISSGPTVGQGGVVQNLQTFSTSNTSSSQNATPLTTSNQVNTSEPSAQKIFKIADGPIAAATLVQLSNPTTTLARYVMQDSGHVLDVPIDVAGAIARVDSSITIPGLGNAVWLPGSSGVIVQYAENGVVKTVSLTFPTTATATTAPRVHFLPDGIESVAPSPDGKSVAYLLPTSAGASGYIAHADGAAPVQLFSSPLTQTLISWPSNQTLLLQSKEAAGVPGIALAVSALTGATTPLVYTDGLSATANSAFSKVVYQTTPKNAARTTYAHDVKSGKDLELPFNPFPEKCIWSSRSQLLLFCAAPLDATPSYYLDLWHQGLYNAADGIFSFDVGQGITTLVALPGGAQGGAQADIASMAVSADGKYLLYVTRGDRSLWGVRL